MKTTEFLSEAVTAINAEFETADRVMIGVELMKCEELLNKMKLFSEYSKVRYNADDLEKFKIAHPNFKEEQFRKADWQVLCEEFAEHLDYVCIPLRKVALDVEKSNVFTTKVVEYTC